MAPMTIIWDFDGTILHSEPYDSEQTLLLYHLQASRENGTISGIKRFATRLLIFADRREWFRFFFRTFKFCYLRILKNTSEALLDKVAEQLSNHIPASDREIYPLLAGSGHRMVVVSCGTEDLGERILKTAGLYECFEAVVGNRFSMTDGRITGMNLSVLKPEDKLTQALSLGIDPEQCMVVGDGYSDLPLLDRAGVPVLVDRTGKKRGKYARKGYRFISSIQEIVELVK